jgi:hypothetical protein
MYSHLLPGRTPFICCTKPIPTVSHSEPIGQCGHIFHYIGIGCPEPREDTIFMREIASKLRTLRTSNHRRSQFLTAITAVKKNN